ncbi:acetyltransferase [Gordonia phage VanLee]|uniref:Acetyltransferase n=1 Tax=Gordonia phage VanLee TaxID=2845816 RepID=A0A8F2IFH5_9CAUD|nr:acetyltransferase [Gordonia phage VanLee]QWS68246.1 acetyltransferase [Gordonia phage VanLee]
MRKPRPLSSRHRDAIRRIASPEGERQYGGRIGDPIRAKKKPPTPDDGHQPDPAAPRPAKKAAAKKTPAKKAAKKVARKPAAKKAPATRQPVRPPSLWSDNELDDRIDALPEGSPERDRLMAEYRRRNPPLPDLSTEARESGGDADADAEIMDLLGPSGTYRTADPPPPPPIPEEHRLSEVSIARVLDGRTTIAEAAEKMSGRYGPYYVRFGTHLGEGSPAARRIPFAIHTGTEGTNDTFIGNGDITFKDRRDGMVVHAGLLQVDDDFKNKGFGGAFQGQLLGFFVANGVRKVEVNAGLEDGGSHWAQPGVRFDDANPHLLADSVDSIAIGADHMLKKGGLSPRGREKLEDVIERMYRVTDLEGRPAMHIDFPTPYELKSLRTADEPDLGDRLMRGRNWHGVLDL